jgi:S-layer homology domain
MKKFSAFCNHYLNSVILSLFFLIFIQISGLGHANAADSQLRAEIGPNKSYVILENSQIYVKYEAYTHLNDEFAIKEFKIKSAGNENQVGVGSYNYFDADSGRWGLKSASIIYNGADKKTVRLIWYGERNDPIKDITHEVTIFGDSKYLKIDYINVKYGINVVDLGLPGGTSAGTHVAYGHSGWDRDYITFQESGPFFGSYYNRYPPDGVNDPVDGGSLNYNGNFIVGVYNSSNGRGFGRVMPVADTSIFKLLLTPTTRRGLEMFPHPFLKSHNPFTGYLYVVTGGESEMLSMGKQLAGGGTPQGFADVPSGYWAEDAIYKIYDAGITTGCSQDPLQYCPEDPVSRSQMAIFLGRAEHGSSYTPPSATGIFEDVPVSYWAAGWIEQFYNDGITSGCSTNPLKYCPDDSVTRAQMAIFLLRAKHGSSYTPPAATGIFDDVPTSSWVADWVEQLYNEGITTGCGANPLSYCPEDTVTRAQMAVFIVRTFGL